MQTQTHTLIFIYTSMTDVRLKNVSICAKVVRLFCDISMTDVSTSVT